MGRVTRMARIEDSSWNFSFFSFFEIRIFLFYFANNGGTYLKYKCFIENYFLSKRHFIENYLTGQNNTMQPFLNASVTSTNYI